MNVERYIERLFGDEGLTDGLTDEGAKPLLEWAESTLCRWIEAARDEASAEREYAVVRGALDLMAELTLALSEGRCAERLGRLADRLGIPGPIERNENETERDVAKRILGLQKVGSP